MRNLILSVIAATLSFTPFTYADAIVSSIPSSTMAKIAKEKTETKLIYVGRLTGAPDSFVDDKNQNTLQLVTLPKNQGTNHTSENGEVVFMREKISATDQEKLISEALLLKAKFKQATPQTK